MNKYKSKTLMVKLCFSLFSLALLASCGKTDQETKNTDISQRLFADLPNNNETLKNISTDAFFAKDENTDAAQPICPENEPAPEKVAIERGPIGPPPPDLDQELKDLGTTFVVKKFFTSPDTLYNFMKLVYSDVDSSLAKYREQKNLEPRAIFLLFKGGNVLRMIANRIFDMVSPTARNLLKEEYEQYFQRSDADFSVYIDEKKLGDLDYDTVYSEVADLLFSELNTIREKFKENPEKYFNFLQLKSTYASKVLENVFDQLKEITATKDPDNKRWFNATFEQVQLLDNRAKPDLKCNFQGQYDFRTEATGNEVIITRTNQEPNWIENTDNRAIESHWGSNPNKLIKFALVRSKVIFEYFFEKDGEMHRKPIGGELIDISIPHRKDDRLRAFLDNYDKTVAEYTLIFDQPDEKITIKSYSLLNLAEDLQYILFDGYDRPWHGGAKYSKRANRYFFLSIAEMLKDTGLGPVQALAYIADVKAKILDPLSTFFPLNENSRAIAEQLKSDAALIGSTWTAMEATNEFWKSLASFVSERLINSPQDDDESEFKNFLETIQKNIDIASRTMQLQENPIPINDVYQVEIGKLF